jgi:hypothetical protein
LVCTDASKEGLGIVLMQDDAGASTTHQASQRMGQKEQLDRPAHILKYFGIVAPLFNEVVHKDVHLYCKGDLEPLSSRP